MEDKRNIVGMMAEGMPEPESSKQIMISFIDHDDQRYETCGDYIETPDAIHINVSKTRPHYDFLIAVHEMIEQYLVRCAGIPIEEIDQFDQLFEDMRTQYPSIVGDEEPGDNEAAPYNHFHLIAGRIEKWLADTLHVNWDEYENTINSLKQTSKAA